MIDASTAFSPQNDKTNSPRTPESETLAKVLKEKEEL